MGRRRRGRSRSQERRWPCFFHTSPVGSAVLGEPRDGRRGFPPLEEVVAMDHPVWLAPSEEDQRSAAEVRLQRILMEERMIQVLDKLRAVGQDVAVRTLRL